MTREKIKLLIIVKSIDGGTGTFFLNLLKVSKLFNKKEILIKEVVLEKPSFRDVKKYNFKYLRNKNFYPQKYSLSLRNIIYFLNELLYINKTVKRFSPNIILSIDLRCNLLAQITKLLSLNKIKIINTNHIDLLKTIFNKSTNKVNFFLKGLIKLTYNKSDAIVCVSNRLSDSLKKDFNLHKKIITIYNGESFPISKAKKYKPNRKKTITTIARLVEQKDHINLIKGFKLLHNQIPNTQLIIASDGPKKAALVHLVHKIGLKNNVKFVGWVKNIYSLLSKSDVFVLSSRREGFAYVLIEAMSQGLPIISTDTPYGPSEVLDNGNYGILVPMKKPKLLSRAMYKLLTNGGLYNHYSLKSSVINLVFHAKHPNKVFHHIFVLF